jgi:hypothetical protein
MNDCEILAAENRRPLDLLVENWSAYRERGMLDVAQRMFNMLVAQARLLSKIIFF